MCVGEGRHDIADPLALLVVQHLFRPRETAHQSGVYGTHGTELAYHDAYLLFFHDRVVFTFEDLRAFAVRQLIHQRFAAETETLAKLDWLIGTGILTAF